MEVLSLHARAALSRAAKDKMTELISPNEAGRLAAVRRYDILDTPPDGAFDRITRIAARLFNVPMSIVSVVDTEARNAISTR